MLRFGCGIKSAFGAFRFPKMCPALNGLDYCGLDLIPLEFVNPGRQTSEFPEIEKRELILYVFEVDKTSKSTGFT